MRLQREATERNSYIAEIFMAFKSIPLNDLQSNIKAEMYQLGIYLDDRVIIELTKRVSSKEAAIEYYFTNQDILTAYLSTQQIEPSESIVKPLHSEVNQTVDIESVEIEFKNSSGYEEGKSKNGHKPDDFSQDSLSPHQNNEIVRNLISMGFSTEDSVRAAKRCSTIEQATAFLLADIPHITPIVPCGLCLEVYFTI